MGRAGKPAGFVQHTDKRVSPMGGQALATDGADGKGRGETPDRVCKGLFILEGTPRAAL